MNSHVILARVLSGIISLFQASNLRNRVYEQCNRIESLELAIEDIARIASSDTSPEHKTRLILRICSSTSPKTHE